MRLIVAAGVVLLALTGCAPDTSDAHEVCARSQITLWQLQHPDATLEEFADQAAAIAEECLAAAAADPAGFNEVWAP
jgi:hypothetical protein